MPFPEDVPLLTDGVVTLRAHRSDDTARMVEQCSDAASVAWTTAPSPYGPQEAASFLGETVATAWESGRAAYFAIEHEGRFAGTVDLRLSGTGEAEVGFGLHPDARGRGVMRRALVLALDWAYAERGLSVVTWRAQAGNWASRRVAWSVGFTFGPTVPAMLHQRGESRDAWIGWLGRDDPRTPTTSWLSPAELRGNGVRLRGWRDGDGPRLVEAAHDPVLRAAIPRSPLPRHPSEVADYLLRVGLGAATGERVAWCVADPRADVALGNVAVFGFGEGSAEVGFWAHPEGRGRGVMGAALALVTRHALTPHEAGGLGVRRLDLLTAAPNRGARGLAERAGFTLVGVERATAPRLDGGWDDTARYELVGPHSG